MDGPTPADRDLLEHAAEDLTYLLGEVDVAGEVIRDAADRLEVTAEDLADLTADGGDLATTIGALLDDAADDDTAQAVRAHLKTLRTCSAVVSAVSRALGQAVE